MNEKAGYATRRIRKSEILLEGIERYNPIYSQGLSLEQVLQRQKRKLTNQAKKVIGKTTFEIIMANVFSFFNILLYIIAAAMIWVQNFGGLFLPHNSLVANTLIGLIQDFRAKKDTKRTKHFIKK